MKRYSAFSSSGRAVSMSGRSVSISSRVVSISAREVSISSRSEKNGANRGSKGGSCPGPQTKVKAMLEKKRLKVKWKRFEF